MKVNRRAMLTGTAAAASLPLLNLTARAEQSDPKIPEGAVILVAQIKARPGAEEEVKQALLAMVEPTRKEKGCLCYNLHQAKDDKTLFMFYEQWENQAALDAHGKSPHMGVMRQALSGKTAPGGGATSYQYLSSH